MRKIALRGLIGRKRETLLLWIVVALAFLFLALPTTLITSLEATDAAQRIATYGSWQLLASDLPSEHAQELAALAEESAVLPMLPVSGADYFQGDNSYLFTAYTPELAEMGQFRLREGRWPEADNEIVLEYARLAALGLEMGDQFTVRSQLTLPMLEKHIQENTDDLAAFNEEARERMLEHCLGIFRERDWELLIEPEDLASLTSRTSVMRIGGESYQWEPDYLDLYQHAATDNGAAFFLYWLVNYQDCAWLFATDDNLDGLAVPLWELTEEQFITAFSWFSGWTVDRFNGYAEPAATVDLLGLDDLSVRLNFRDGLGQSGPMELTMTYQYTVCGVMETYTDRWDNGRMELPGGFVTPKNYQLFLDGQRAALEKYPYFESADFDSLVLLKGSGEASALWREAMGPYNRAMLTQYSFTTPVYQSRLIGATYDEQDRLADYEESHIQISFQFALADQAAPSRDSVQWVNAWLAFPQDGYYCSDHLLGEEDGELYMTATSGIDELVQVDESVYQFPTQNSFGYSYSMNLEGNLEQATVRFDLDGQRYDIPFPDFRDHDFTVNGLGPVLVQKSVWLEDLDGQTDFTPLRVNRFAYPSSAENGENLLMLVMGILFVTTVCAVFQICFTQIRRRLRRVVLLKSLGAETRQVAGLMCWEFLYFWATALPIGTALGLLTAWIVTGVLGSAQGRTVLLVIQPSVLLAAMAAGTLALALGMAVPAAMAAGVPLTGRTVRKKPLPPPKKETRQDFFHITLRGLAAKKGRTAGMFALCVFMMSIALLCLFLGFRMMGEYRDTVVRDGKPDYLLRSPYAMSLRQRDEYLAELEELGVCGDVSTFFRSDSVKMPRSVWEESPLLTAAAGEEAEDYPVSLWCISSKDPLFAQLQDAATVGTLDPEAFENGDQVLLLVPLYRDTGRVDGAALETAEGWARLSASGIDTSYYAEYNGIYSPDEAIQAGETLSLQAEFTTVHGTSYYTSFTSASPTVGAILYYFPGQGIWPLSGGEGWQVVASQRVLSTLLPDSCTTRNQQAVRAIYIQQNALSRVSGAFGNTDFYINCREDVPLEQADTALLIFARNHSMDIEVYHESSQKLLRDALNNILLVFLLGLTAVLLALVIFSNTLTSDLEQERGRIGILQALGVSNRLFALRQLILGLAASGTALALSNILLWTGAALFAGTTGAVLGNFLWGYPAAWHVLLCLALAAVLTLLFLLPMFGLWHYLPVENIKSKK